jgi:kynurenine 3-monooxygenase
VITIVGAGLVGSMWAVLLRQQGYEVTIFERRSDPRQNKLNGGRSINLIITSKGLFALEQAGLLEQAIQLSVPVYGRMIHPKSGDLVYQPYGQGKECNLSISRSALNLFLIDEAERAGAKIIFGHEVHEIDAAAKKIQFQTSSGLQEYSYEILFGADGSGSRIRKLMAVHFPNQIVETTEWLDADYKELTLPLGPNGKPPLRHDALHIWPRGSHMMMALANRDGSFTMTAYLPKSGKTWAFDKVHSESEVESLFKSEFPDAISLMPDYKSEFINNPQGVLGTVRSSRWVFADSIALMGDAAHGIVPFFGQGMNSGFDDCSCLLKMVKKHRGSWENILKNYELEQKPNADAIADMALENWVEMRDKVGDQNFQLRKKLESALEQKFPGIFKARYGLITYTLAPYSAAKKAGMVQAEILDELLHGVHSLEEVSWSKAHDMIAKKWVPFVNDCQLDLTPFIPPI